jgi:hypothetical protein
MAASPIGGLYVAIPERKGTIVVFLGSNGRPRPGWPVRVGSGWCPTLLAPEDGSVRLICEVVPEDDGLRAPMSRVYAFDRTARSLPGWPVEIEAGYTARMIGDDLHVLVVPYEGDTPAPDAPDHVLVAVISPDGVVRRGSDVPLFDCCENALGIGPDGTGYVTTIEYPQSTSRILAFDQMGTRSGWPVTIDGQVSRVAFDAQSRVYVAVAGDDATTWTIVFDATGQGVGGAGGPLPYSTNPWIGAGAEGPGPLFVAADGTAFLVSGEDGTTIVALDPGSTPMAGWPYHSALPTQLTGGCGEGDTGCGYLRVDPAIGPGNVLYVSLAAAKPSTGGQIVAIRPNGRVREGWPVRLRRAGSMFWAVLVGPEGTVHALAIEPETDDRSSATILGIAPDSTVLYRTTIVEP